METVTDKKQAIFDSMLDLVREHGFHGTPMSQVAKQANVAAGTIYHYFESKDHLIQSLYDYNRGTLVNVIQVILKQTTEASYREQFYTLWMGLYEFYIQRPSVLVFFEQYHNSPYSTGQNEGYLRGTLYDFFEEGVRQHQFRPIRTELLITLTISSINAAAKLTLFNKVAIEQDDLNQITDILWRGVAASE